MYSNNFFSFIFLISYINYGSTEFNESNVIENAMDKIENFKNISTNLLEEKITDPMNEYIEPEPFKNLRCGIQTKHYQRIVGGVETSVGEFPWIILIYYVNSNIPKCGGSIIHKNFILTVAHCLTGNIIKIVGKPDHIRVGEHNMYTNPDCFDSHNSCAPPHRDYKIKNTYPHPEFVTTSFNQYHDIGLIQLFDDIVFTEFVQPICLPNNDNEYYSEQYDRFFIGGWGRTEYAPYSAVKLRAILPYVGKTRCQQIYSNSHRTIGNGQICAGGEIGIDTCTGDSGNALMDTIKTNYNELQWIIIGIVSYGPKECGISNYPAVHTKVGRYLKWIKRRTFNALNS